MIARGFKSRYLSFQAIATIVSYILISSKNISYKSFKKNYFNKEKKESNSPLKISLLENSSLSNDMPCYCNIVFACLAYKVLKLTRIKKPPICKCRKTKSGIAPPIWILEYKSILA